MQHWMQLPRQTQNYLGMKQLLHLPAAMRQSQMMAAGVMAMGVV